jgi:hypothetical protein
MASKPVCGQGWSLTAGLVGDHRQLHLKQIREGMSGSNSGAYRTIHRITVVWLTLRPRSAINSTRFR